MEDEYYQAFIIRAHQLLAWGYAKARHQVGSDTEEEVISQYICTAIREIVTAVNVPEGYEQFDALDERPVSDTGKTGKRRRIIDIVLDMRDGRFRPEFVCEAKRLKASAYTIQKYAGKDGLLRFVNEEYAARYNIGAMLGYMQSNDAKHWHEQLSACFKEPQRTQISVHKDLMPLPIIADLPNEWSSEHARPTKAPILVYHIFFECT